MKTYKPGVVYQTFQRRLTTRRGQAYGSLTLSLLTAIFFVIFAIRPTVLTIVSLRRQVSDLQRVDRQIREKIDTLSRLSFSYRSIEPDLATIETAVPQKTDLSNLIVTLASAGENSATELSHLSIGSLSFTSVSPEVNPKLILPQLETVGFSATYQGPYEGLMTTLESVNHLNRLILVDQFSMASGGDLDKVITLTIKGRAFNLSLN